MATLSGTPTRGSSGLLLILRVILLRGQTTSAAVRCNPLFYCSIFGTRR